MSCTPQQAVRYAASYLGDLFDSMIGQVTEEIETVETGDIEIENAEPPSVEPPPEDSPKPPTMVDSVITWG